MSCQGCPCPEKCLQWPIFCEWVANGETVRFAHICLRSSIKPGEPQPPIVRLENDKTVAGRGCCGGNPYEHLI